MAVKKRLNGGPNGNGYSPAAPPEFVATLKSVLLLIGRPLASLKLTVVMFSLAIFLVFAGTLAQYYYDIWFVVKHYFRTPLAFIEFKIFFPGSLIPRDLNDPTHWMNNIKGGFYFPGGWLIGGILFLNLAAAHLLRFKIQAKGSRLWTGLGVIAAGALLTGLVIAAGNDKDGFQQSIWAKTSWDTLWLILKIGLGLLCGAVASTLAKIHREQKAERWTVLIIAVVLGLLTTALWVAGDTAKLDPSGMRILWQLIKALLAGGVLLAGCILVFRKRAGVVLLHAGVGLMMFGEFYTGLTAVEERMTVEEGETVRWAQDTREVELAVVDPGDPDHDVVTVVPQSVLLAGGVIDHESLPFRIEVLKYLENAHYRSIKPGEETEATHGAGRHVTVDEVEPVTGLDEDINWPAALVRLTGKGGGEKDLGVWLLSTQLEEQEIEVDGEVREIALRFKRSYKPYSVHLIDVHKRDYIGTTTPMNYESRFRLVDPRHKVDREVRVWMNNPVRYAGETFYQSGYNDTPQTVNLVDPQTGRKTGIRDFKPPVFNPETGRMERPRVEVTTLQIVTNDGWMVPYVGCMLVAVGMLAHFWIVLLRFLNRRVAAAPIIGGLPAPAPVPENVQRQLAGEGDPADGPGSPEVARRARQPSLPDLSRNRSWWSVHGTWIVPLLVVLASAGWFASKVRPPRSNENALKLHEFGKLPVVFRGRVKPIDSLARNSLKIISERQTAIIPKDEEALEREWDDILAEVRDRWGLVADAELPSARAGPQALSEAIEQKTGDDPQRIEAFVEKLTHLEQPAIRWLMDVIAHPEKADRYRIFRIENFDVLSIFNLSGRKSYRYSYAELEPKMEEFNEQYELAEQVKKQKRSLVQRTVVDLAGALHLYRVVKGAFQVPPPASEMKDPLARLERLANFARISDRLRNTPYTVPTPEGEEPWGPLTIPAGRIWVRELAQELGADSLSDLARALADDLIEAEVRRQVDEVLLARLTMVARKEYDDLSKEDIDSLVQDRFRRMPDDLRTRLAGDLPETARKELQADRADLEERLLAVLRTVSSGGLGEPVSPVAHKLIELVRAYRHNDAAKFNAALDEYPAAIASVEAEDYRPGMVRFETLFNQAEPFYYSAVLYVVAFVLAALAWLGWQRPLNWASFSLIAFTFVIHTAALIARIWLSGRPPVTNLYSSAVFIGWAGVVLGMVMELVYRMGVGNVIAAVAGFGTLLIAHHLSLDGDTITVMQAVLDTNFWLATHVVCITLGYATTFVAGLLGLVYVLRGMLTPSLTESAGKDLARMVYGTLCFAILFSFVGTVLGGLWADDSWGRFWGWDPKENGALIIVLWNAIVLHARWGGMVRERGLAVLAIGGNIVTAWSWFGVNLLGVGLHAYGFIDGLGLGLMLFALTQLAVMAAGALPKRCWWSFRRRDDLTA